MTSFVFPPPAVPVIPVQGTDAVFPIHRIFCVGRNYEAHAKEMGHEADRDAPFYFTKSPANAIASGLSIPYPPGTSNYHHEMEFSVLIGADGFRVGAEDAGRMVYGYCCSLDMTRRDRQQDGKDKRRPWDLGKDFENASVFGTACLAADFGDIADQRISLDIDGETRQDAVLSDLIHSVPEVIADLSQYYHLRAGDVIMTGTPAGVGAVQPGDHLIGCIDGLPDVSLTVGAAE